jgi:transglutaminase-like putative cysteine protease
MKTYYTAVLIILMCLGISSSYYTYSMEVLERERGQSLSHDIQQVETEIAQIGSILSTVEEKQSETEALIQEEVEKQEEVQGQIDASALRKVELEETLALYKNIAQGDPRVLITVDDSVVKAKAEEITRFCQTTEEKQLAVFEYVRNEIEYITEGNPKKWYYPRPFLQYKYEFWQLPRETIEWGKGDCEDQAILLCTLMRAIGVPASDVRVVVGLVSLGGGTAHAWTEFKLGTRWYILESTCPTCDYIKKSEYYEFFSPEIWGWFNDKEFYKEESSEKDDITGTRAVCL